MIAGHDGDDGGDVTYSCPLGSPRRSASTENEGPPVQSAASPRIKGDIACVTAGAFVSRYARMRPAGRCGQ